MSDTFFTFIFLPPIVIAMIVITRYIRNKFYKPRYENGVRSPGKLEKFVLNLFIFIDGLLVSMLLLNIFMKDIEMVLVSGGLAVFIFAIILILKHAYRTSYQENAEYFILKSKKKEYHVFYENIIEWDSSFNEIGVLDKSKIDEDFIKVNIVIFKPEILLRKIADMTFADTFHSLDGTHLEDPHRKTELVNYLIYYNYGYLVNDYIKKLNQA